MLMMVPRILAIEDIVSYDSKYDEPWGTEQCNNYRHVYPVEWNKEKVEEPSKPKRMTRWQVRKCLEKCRCNGLNGL